MVSYFAHNLLLTIYKERLTNEEFRIRGCIDPDIAPDLYEFRRVDQVDAQSFRDNIY